MAFELTNQAFHDLWEHFALGPKPLYLNAFPEGILESDRRQAQQRAREELRRHGFGDRDSEDDLLGLLTPLTQYEHAFDMRYQAKRDDEVVKYTGMAACVRGDATIGVHNGRTVRLGSVPRESMVKSLLSVLPEMKPGEGRAVSLRSAQLDSAAAMAGDSLRKVGEALMRHGIRRDDALALARMAAAKRTGYAQFGVTRMDQLGKRQRATQVTSCFGTEDGWYLLEESLRGSEPWTTFAPVDKQRMAGRIQVLANAFRGG